MFIMFVYIFLYMISRYKIRNLFFHLRNNFITILLHSPRTPFSMHVLVWMHAVFSLSSFHARA